MRSPIYTLLAISLLALPLSAQTTTICKDGTSTGTSGRSACNRHRGVDRAASKRATKRTSKSALIKQQQPAVDQKVMVEDAKVAGALVLCTDGSSSEPGQGACWQHGGVRAVGTPLPAPVPRTPEPARPGLHPLGRPEPLRVP